MGRSIYSIHRDKIEFTNTDWFRVGDEFVTKPDGTMVYYTLRDVKGWLYIKILLIFLKK